MSSSRSNGPRQVPPPPGSRTAASYTRFIPREELQGFASWMPDSFGDTPAQASAAPEPAPAPAEPSAAEWQAEVNAARQAGYQDGYRDGLSALESFKQSFARQMSGQFAPLVQSFDAQLGALEQRIAASVAQVAVQLARQVVRSELAARPALVAQVAQEAVHAVLMSAKHIVVHVNPADQALIDGEAAETLAARGARMVGQASIERGGCLVETDAGTIDARVEARWNDTVQALGTEVPWHGDPPPATTP
ncbi:FliH/SctL family protein [Ideonella sp. A 288]|uniref:FliH/SctL family protein n=1 Tax=Ideonella sp. A 288 TaxID=1962181 RepID=UPI000B4B9DAF|nr:FliH/SctL family protein [Ideonella sp. A 288]